MTLSLRPRRRFLGLLLFLIVFSSCQKEYDFEQKKPELSTLGDELHKVWIKDAARSEENSDAKVQMLQENQASFINAINVLIPEDQLEAVDQFLRNILKLVDDGIVPALTRKLILILDDAARDPALLQSLAVPTGPDVDTYFSPAQKPNVLGYASRFADLPRLVELIGRIISENDGFDDQGLLTFEEPSAISDILRVLANVLEGPNDSDISIPATIRDMFLNEDPRYQSSGSPLWAVRFDDRGYPLAATVQGEVQVPFVDNDGDGLADLDANGNFIYRNGGSGLLRPFASDVDINEPTTRDNLGRAQTGGANTFAYQYIDLQSTGLGFLIRQMRILSNNDAIVNLLQAFQLILGSKRVYTDEIGGYEGYDTNNPMADMTFAGMNIIDSPALPDFLEGTSELTDRRTPQMAKLFAAISRLGTIVDRYPDAGMNDNETLIYDLIPHLAELTETPEIWADVLDAFRDPINRKTGEAFATMIAFSDSDSVPAMDGPYDSCFQQCKQRDALGSLDRYACIRACPMAEIFDEPSNLKAEESEKTITAFQKFVHLIRDTNGAPFSMAIIKAEIDGSPLPALPPLIRFEDQGATFVQSVGGNLDLADNVPAEVFQSDLGDLLNLLGVEAQNVASLLSILSPLFGAELSRMATPDELTRFLNQEDIKFETTTTDGTHVIMDMSDPVCNDNYRLSEHYVYTLFQAEAAGVVDTLHPLAKALSNHNKEHLIGGILSVVHDHYSSRTDLYKTKNGSISPTKGANLRSYEETLADIFSNSEIFDALFEFAVAVKGVEEATGLPIEESLRQILQKAFAKDGFKNRRGEDYVLVADGRTINNATRFEHVLASIDAANTRLSADPVKKEKFKDSVRAMLNVMLDAKFDPNTGQAQFAQPGSAALTIDTTRFLAQEARKKQAQGQLSPWIQNTLLTGMEDLWKSRMMASMADLAANILANDADKKTIDDLMTYQLGSSEGQAQAIIAIYSILVKSVDTSHWEPIAKFLSKIVDPDHPWLVEPYRDVPLVSLGAQLLSKTLEADPDNSGIFLISRGLDRINADSPFSILIDIVARYFSPDPLADTFTSGDDYGHFIQQMSLYLSDDLHGMERLYEVVDQRSR